MVAVASWSVSTSIHTPAEHARPHAVGAQVGGGDQLAPLQHPDRAKNRPQRLVVSRRVDPPTC